MNYLTKNRFLVVACAIGAGVSQTSIAADAMPTDTATATIDWSQLELSVTGVNDTVPTVVFSDQSTSLSSYASSPGLNESNSKSVNDWSVTAETNADAGSTYANATASPSSFSGNAISMEDGSASAWGNRTVDFSFDGPGVLTVTIPYSITLTADDSGCYYCYNYDHASVSGYANFNSYVDNGNSSSYSDASFSLNNYYWNPSPESQSGTLVFGIFASGAGHGSLGVNFDLSAQGVSAVPEPESYAMLLAGLGLMGAAIRRRSVGRYA